MTVQAENPIQRYSYSGPGRYDFDFDVFNESEVYASHVDEDGLVYELKYPDDFSVTLVGSESANPGYIVTVNPVATTGTLEILRQIPITQEVDWVNNNSFDMEILESSMDKTIMIIQQLAAEISEGNTDTTWRGNWATGTSYELKDMVVGPNNSWYYCIIEHTSGTFDDDLASGYWILTLDIESLENLVSQAAQSEANARDSATAAKASEDAAAISEANASDSEDNAAMSELNAANCAAESYQSALESKQYRDEAASIIAAGKVVDVMNDNYFTASFGQTEFTINPPTPQTYILVFMNSRKLRLGEDFTTDNPALATKVILSSGAVSGDEIDVTLFNSISGSA